MLTFSQSQIAAYFNARNRRNLPALTVLAALEASGKLAGANPGALRGHLDRLAQKAGVKINLITAGQAADLLDNAWGRYADAPKPATAVAQWRARMGLSQRAAAEALGLSLPAYQEHERGASFAGRAREPSRLVLLACAALEQGLSPA